MIIHYFSKLSPLVILGILMISTDLSDFRIFHNFFMILMIISIFHDLSNFMIFQDLNDLNPDDYITPLVEANTRRKVEIVR